MFTVLHNLTRQRSLLVRLVTKENEGLRRWRCETLKCGIKQIGTSQISTVNR